MLFSFSTQASTRRVSLKTRGRFVPSLLVGLACMFALAACSLDGASKKDVVTETPQGARPPRTSLPMPPVESAHRTSERTALEGAGGWTMLDGRRASLLDYRGQVVVLDFYATYCPPCRDEIPHLVALQKRLDPQGFKVVGLNVGGAEDRDKVPDYVKSLGIQYQLGEPDEEMSNTFLSENDVIPQTFVFDRDGRLVEHFTGFDDGVAADLENAVQTAMRKAVTSGK